MSAFRSDDLPTFERPRNATSGIEEVVRGVWRNFEAEKSFTGVWGGEGVKRVFAVWSWDGVGGLVSQ